MRPSRRSDGRKAADSLRSKELELTLREIHRNPSYRRGRKPPHSESLVDCTTRMASLTTRGVETIGGYTVIRREPLDRLEGEYIELVHERTGARHIHIRCTDDNNAFAVSFPTVPQDSTGVAHILEHVVLAGSKRFPVRDPFFSMTRRSLATFMNAFTSSDSTTYPFSTRNPKDYINLLLVYLDATVSGGDPEHIPDLTWEGLRRFHAAHYHPSNAYFYTYGDQPLDRTLAAIEENVLSHFERIDVDTSIPYVTRFK